MHLLATQPGVIPDGSEAVDLGQSPGDIVVLSAADTEIACLAAAQARLGCEAPTLRLANLARLGHNFSVDRYLDRTVAPDEAKGARMVVIRLLGGRSYWPYGVEQLVQLCRAGGILLALLPGDDRPDPDLSRDCTLPAPACLSLWRYLIHGGPENAGAFLAFAANLIGSSDVAAPDPVALPRAGFYRPAGSRTERPGAAAQGPAKPVAALLFYRALVQSGDLAPIDALIAALEERGLATRPIFLQSLKDPEVQAFVRQAFAADPPDIVLNATAFAAGPGAIPCDAPVLQTIFAGGSEAEWRQSRRGLRSRDLAMHVVLPELDGRIIGRAISFKDSGRICPLTEAALVTHQPVPDRVAFTAELAAAWVRLRRLPVAERRVAVLLATYPDRAGRSGTAVGLDAPASALAVLYRLAEAGYGAAELPPDPQSLLAPLLRSAGAHLSLGDYQRFFAALPPTLRDAVSQAWGLPEADPAFRDGGFAVPVSRFCNLVVGLQPQRGHGVDQRTAYHSPDLPPTHGYIAFYAWLRQSLRVDAIVQMGKHGSLEWLPGKAVALGADCTPEALHGPVPHLYPFIVNDPGEGTQAKRRAAAVIIDHLTPPPARAGDGAEATLNRAMDEYYQAATLDPRRLPLVEREILDAAASSGLDRDAGCRPDTPGPERVARLDSYLCELKDLQIRDGLHVFGQSPTGAGRTALLLAISRTPPAGSPELALTRALARDLGLDYNPVETKPEAVWHGPIPPELECGRPWRHAGDAGAALERLAGRLIAGEAVAEPAWTRTAAALGRVRDVLVPAVDACGPAEMAALLRGLDGRFVEPGPAGAPTRGRPEVLPTGRNFYGLDARQAPTAAAWTLGWRAAQDLVLQHAQREGRYPARIALAAWGTSCMRSGGDDIAQALALLGVRPVWESATGRVTGFEIMPTSVLDRPRVDVTLRISGLFRDAFANLIDLFDGAVCAVAGLDEDAETNPLAASVRAEAAALEASGLSRDEARRFATYRVFGAEPGAHGTGLQAALDRGDWRDERDLAALFRRCGGTAYGAGSESRPAEHALAARLHGAEAVLVNQDDREHDVLDSAGYWQFAGGLALAIRDLTGRTPAIYHGDHSREMPVLRTLDAEIARIVRARATNPAWLAGIMRHGHAGAAELSQTVDALVAFAVTARAVPSHHFDAVFEAYLGDDTVRGFLANHNPAALSEIAGKMREALERGLWQPRRNSAPALLDEIS